MVLLVLSQEPGAGVLHVALPQVRRVRRLARVALQGVRQVPNGVSFPCQKCEPRSYRKRMLGMMPAAVVQLLPSGVMCVQHTLRCLLLLV
jgi:hypothetical protein